MIISILLGYWWVVPSSYKVLTSCATSFVYYPQNNSQLAGNASTIHSAFNDSQASEDGKLKAGYVFVGIGLFIDGSLIEKMQKHSEHPLSITMLNLSIECRKKVEAWQLVSLLLDVEVSDLEKKSIISDLSTKRLALYHRSTGFLLEPFRDPNKCYELFVHGLGKTKVFFQIGMIIGDTDEINKTCGFRGGNGKYRLHTCRDCTVTTPNSDNPYAKCEPRLVSYTKPYLEWALKNIHHSDGKLPNLPDSFDIKQSRRYATQQR